MPNVGGYMAHQNPRLFRVPDLLTAEQFTAYMADVYGVEVEFKGLVKDSPHEVNQEADRLAAPDDSTFVKRTDPDPHQVDEPADFKGKPANK